MERMKAAYALHKQEHEAAGGGGGNSDGSPAAASAAGPSAGAKRAPKASAAKPAASTAPAKKQRTVKDMLSQANGRQHNGALQANGVARAEEEPPHVVPGGAPGPGPAIRS
ncbi:hypothetical protein MNEG_15401 [Monoraphidium neglectum]|uniref:Uncharacterized protein n=1 Tax=Monoraphidium neglectum TaxID=145388 RepID=A0A0D2LRP8_9CHLO|nr:hypothetical protein MNEG_15401 [Monoraphidium neglectum]KIY92561.1 hypothetical protein MNEG_15401 [Monoraphidium neglectum]|eukprot:XP_013891581.1 hypothetical protein MNEG_15401 [Monoraphidium neglectum]